MYSGPASQTLIIIDEWYLEVSVISQGFLISIEFRVSMNLDEKKIFISSFTKF